MKDFNIPAPFQSPTAVDKEDTWFLNVQFCSIGGMMKGSEQLLYITYTHTYTHTQKKTPEEK